MRRQWRYTVGIGAALLGGCGLPSQQGRFGQNSVQYDEFDFSILETPHFDIYFYEEGRDVARDVGRMAERWYTRLSRLLNHELRERQPLFLYASHPHFRQTTQIFGAPGEGTGGVTEALKRRIVMPAFGPLAETDHVVGHELVHAFQFDMTQPNPGTLSNRNFPRALVLPLWFAEGMAEYVSLGAQDSHTAMWIRDAAAADRIPTFSQLANPRFFPYRFGQAFWAYVAGRFGDDVIGRILNAGARAGTAEAAVERILGIPVDTLAAEWRMAISRAYDQVRERTEDAAAYGTVMLERQGGRGLNWAPVLSPDGTQLIFLSVRDVASIDVYRADVATGRVRNKLVETRSDPHYEGIQFLHSAGSWNPAGTEFVLATVIGSDPALTVVDVETGRPVRERVFADLGEIFNPTWAPRGDRIAFTALAGGYTDLYIYDFATDGLHRLTNDAYADLHPAWSPDGRRIAFATDRYTTDLARLAYGPYRLATIDPVNDQIVAVGGFPGAKHVNPQWTHESDGLFFLADPEGITNLYRVDLGTGVGYQVTNLYGGISGITKLSPALTAARGTPRVAFTAYERGDYNVYVVTDTTVLAGRRLGVLGDR